MAMPARLTEWTVDMVRALPDDSNRYEIIDGELFVTPAPSVVHQRAVLELALVVAPYVRAHRVGEVIISPADVLVFGPRKFVQPDLFVLPLIGGAPVRDWIEAGRLLLTVEVLSPSTIRTDRGKKRETYQDKGVPEYWIVDTDARILERWTPNDDTPEVLSATLEWSPDAAAPSLRIDLVAYFDRVLGLGS
jgi:Uma2 family endonuclease